MQWIIRRNTEGDYIASKRVTVTRQRFARKFNSRKQAHAYLRESNYDKKKCSVIEFDLSLPENMKDVTFEYVEKKVYDHYAALHRKLYPEEYLD